MAKETLAITLLCIDILHEVLKCQNLREKTRNKTSTTIQLLLWMLHYYTSHLIDSAGVLAYICAASLLFVHNHVPLAVDHVT